MCESSQKYALVTGGSSGLGRALSLRLAALGYGVVVVSHQQEANDEVLDALQKRTSMPCYALTIDLTTAGAADEVVAYTDSLGLELSLVALNAGGLLFGGFATHPLLQVDRLVALHVSVNTRLCYLYGKRMVARRAGYILITSSASASMHYPSIALYAASKSYLGALADALHDEWQGYGVVVTGLYPGAVDTSFYSLDNRLRRWCRRLRLMHSAEQIAERALRGLFRGKRRVVPGVMTRLMVLLTRLCPAWTIRRIVALKGVRKLLE
ncbi:MAG: SDR family NAD(P)-dependent oxidoreductase [Rikenellaceae bacterium]|nr:SDR family NAD(P)-dependent oxidoreductase [Rikenellaceae bacterium]